MNKQPKLYMAYNHNGTQLLSAPTTDKKVASKEAKDYRYATNNPAFVEECNQEGEPIS